MTKRKLTRRQAWRVNKIQEERSRRAAAKDQLAEESLAAGELGAEREGLITAHYGTQVMVEAAQGESQRCHLRANLEGLVTGDRVVWCPGDPTGVVVAQLERHSELRRPDPHGALKPVAANIDQILIVVAPYPEPHANLIDRYLVAAENVQIRPVLLLNKTDLLNEDPALEQGIAKLLEPYASLGYQLLHTSTKAGGMAQLHAALSDRISVFVGQSGVGKSSLVNALLPEAGLRVGALSETTLKGTHTTTTAQLFHLPSGGTLIDSPGIREFGLWHMDKEQVEAGFVEFRPHLGRCKFRDCQHQQEPDCAILQAAEDGSISAARLESYRRIIGSLDSS